MNTTRLPCVEVVMAQHESHSRSNEFQTNMKHENLRNKKTNGVCLKDMCVCISVCGQPRSGGGVPTLC